MLPDMLPSRIPPLEPQADEIGRDSTQERCGRFACAQMARYRRGGAETGAVRLAQSDYLVPHHVHEGVYSRKNLAIGTYWQLNEL